MREALITVSRRKLPARGWQGDSVYTERPRARSGAVSPRRMGCWRRPITSFTPLRADNKTLTRSLDLGGPPPAGTFPAWPRVWASLMGRSGARGRGWGVPWEAHQAQTPEKAPDLAPIWGFGTALASLFSLGLSFLICARQCHAHPGYKP